MSSLRRASKVPPARQAVPSPSPEEVGGIRRADGRVVLYMTLKIGDQLQAFLAEPNPITIGTTRRDGSVQMSPLWFEFRDGLIWLNGGTTRDWFGHIQRTGQATLLVVDPKNMFRWAQLQARLVDSTREGADDHIDRLSQRYFGGPYPNEKVDRLIIRLEPTRVTGGDMRQPWEVTN
jgi:PPOX class probable F420-dependent enzyme